MDELEPYLGNIANVFQVNTEKLASSVADEEVQVVIAKLQNEMSNALRLLENAIISK